MDREFEIRNWEAGAVGRAWASGIVNSGGEVGDVVAGVGG